MSGVEGLYGRSADYRRFAQSSGRDAGFPSERPEVPPTRLRDEEVFGLDTALAGVIADAVARLRDMDNGHPTMLTVDEWHRILTEIAEGFQAYHDADATGEDAERPDAAFDLLREWWRHLWD